MLDLGFKSAEALNGANFIGAELREVNLIGLFGKILELLQTVDMSISARHLSDVLIKDLKRFHAESAAVVKASP